MRVFVQRNLDRLDTWLKERSGYPPEWQQAAAMIDNLLYLTPDELTALGRDLFDRSRQFQERSFDPSDRPPGALPIALMIFGFPLPSTSSGS